MRLNEDEPLVWRDERSKVRRRGRILEAGETESKKRVSKERGDGLCQIKMKLRKWKLKANMPSGWISTHENLPSSQPLRLASGSMPHRKQQLYTWLVRFRETLSFSSALSLHKTRSAALCIYLRLYFRLTDCSCQGNVFRFTLYTSFLEWKPGFCCSSSQPGDLGPSVVVADRLKRDGVIFGNVCKRWMVTLEESSLMKHKEERYADKAARGRFESQPKDWQVGKGRYKTIQEWEGGVKRWSNWRKKCGASALPSSVSGNVRVCWRWNGNGCCGQAWLTPRKARLLRGLERGGGWRWRSGWSGRRVTAGPGEGRLVRGMWKMAG